jgi:CTP synthase (UTP-ammonia lyase)
VSARRLALVGDRRDAVRAHVAIPRALELASRAAGVRITHEWVPSERAFDLAGADGVWAVPGSPYRSMDGVLAAIHFARTSLRPFLGTCGGFQHAAIEYARQVLGIAGADHTESNPEAAIGFIAPLACSLAGQNGRIALRGRLAEIYGRDQTVEGYVCSYGVAREHEQALDRGPMRVVGVDDDGRVRAIALEDHPFFFATLFQPELSAETGDSPHPLIQAFVGYLGS